MIKVAIIGLGIMGRRMLQHMRIHEKFELKLFMDTHVLKHSAPHNSESYNCYFNHQNFLTIFNL